MACPAALFAKLIKSARAGPAGRIVPVRRVMSSLMVVPLLLFGTVVRRPAPAFAAVALLAAGCAFPELLENLVHAEAA